jgi:polyisoprenyl-phosphate glycosyltransferase
MPRLFGIQSEGSAAVANAFFANTEVITPVSATTIADSISVDLPRDGVRAVRAPRETGGCYITVKDEDILTAIGDIGPTGIFAEPAGATAYAGLKKAIAEGLIHPDDPVVVLNTGSGLKDVRAAMMAVKEAPIIEPSMTALKKHLKHLKRSRILWSRCHLQEKTSTDANPVFSIIAPIFNEQETLPELYRRISAILDSTGEQWELLLVNDGSTDRSEAIIRELAERDQRIRPVLFARNFGHQIAVTAGLDFSRGQAVVIIDADLQDPPELILEMIEKWREGYEVVYAVRGEREGESWFKTFTASFFYRLIYRITDVKIPLDTGDFRLIDRKVVNVLNHMRERHRFLRGMSAWVGFKQTGITYRRAARFAGETKYPFRKMFRLAINAITGFSYFPLQVATYLGFFAAATQYFSNSPGHHFAVGIQPGTAWPGHYPDRGVIHRRCSVNITWNFGGIYRTNLR